MEVMGIIQARLGSERLPNKVLMEIEGEPLLGCIITRLRDIEALGTIIVATTTKAEDEAIVALAERYGVRSFQGDEEDVLSRFVGAIDGHNADTILRLTGDNPLIDPGITRRLIEMQIESSSDYTAMEGLPLGVAPEVVSRKALLEANNLLDKKSPHREHVTSFIRRRPDLFKIKILAAPPHLLRPNWRLTVDTYEDLELVRILFSRLTRSGRTITITDVVTLLDANPGLLEINAHIRQRVVDG